MQKKLETTREKITLTLDMVKVPIDTSADVPLVPKVRVRPGSIVVFQAGDQTVSISFLASGVFPTTAIVTSQTGNISVWLPPDADYGTYEYAIYVHGAGKHGKYAECQSHPIMIVESPRKPLSSL